MKLKDIYTVKLIPQLEGQIEMMKRIKKGSSQSQGQNNNNSILIL